MKTLTKETAAKLAGYATLASTFLAAQNDDAQIVYKNLPNIELTGYGNHQFYIDFNNDGKNDLRLNLLSVFSSDNTIGTFRYEAEPASDAKIVDTAGLKYVSALPLSFSLQKKLPGGLKWDKHKLMGWREVIYWGGNTGSYGGPWASIPSDYHFLGIKIKENGANYFGWVRCKVNTHYLGSGGLTIYGYAFNFTPDAPIKAGQMSDDGTMIGQEKTAQNSEREFSPKISVYNKTANVELNDEAFLNGLLTIYNLTGQAVFTRTLDQLSFSVELNQLPEGIYILNLSNGNKRKSYKFWIE